MKFKPLEEADWRGLAYAATNVPTIKQKAVNLLELLKTTFESPNMLGEGNFRVLPPDDNNSIAKIETFLGDARARLTWKSDREDISGVLLFERKLLDSQDQVFWEPIWALTISSYENPYVTNGDETFVVDMNSVMGNRRQNSAFVAGMTVLYGIVNGPIHA
ncbi:hypothetical protein [Janthinobacterium lividum]|uniref:hypothetical protein n=1 Tax=Janthinobacterium lividum TaxID=29581 RepID=UPI0015952EBA|nr:hypothetical protein [Janthinobacterium lividum]QKY08760.1 hypothetical protein G8765_14040 [Janthinobacterium lividum]QKY09522.1 hypothetical protein G8765_18345 [Janthinobacterium lividum]